MDVISWIVLAVFIIGVICPIIWFLILLILSNIVRRINFKKVPTNRFIKMLWGTETDKPITW
jgi:hypothetical protein